jgi:hypothetical protein
VPKKPRTILFQLFAKRHLTLINAMRFIEARNQVDTFPLNFLKPLCLRITKVIAINNFRTISGMYFWQTFSDLRFLRLLL